MNTLFLSLTIVIILSLFFINYKDKNKAKDTDKNNTHSECYIDKIKYPLTFVIFFTILFMVSKNYLLSLSVSLILVLWQTIYNYLTIKKNNLEIIFSLVIMNIVINNKNWILSHINNTILRVVSIIVLLYICISLLEYLVHRQVMHCDLEKTRKIKNKLIRKHILDSCESHIEHHLDVEADMNISHVSSQKSLYFEWTTTIPLIISTIISFVVAMLICQTNPLNHKMMIVILSIIITIIWQYLWNKVHPEMHNLENTLSIKEGPIEHKLSSKKLSNALLKNHSLHHLQKGSRKGNFNIILLGADEWFGRNNKLVKQSS